MRAYDVIVVGGGHNSLVAAGYLARAGRSVLVLERSDQPGGAAVSAPVFRGIDARLSRYSYLVSLLPRQIVSDLQLRLELRSRPVASYTPVRRAQHHTGLFVEREPGPATADSFRALTGSEREYARWQEFHAQLSILAERLAPTMLRPLPTAADIRKLIGAEQWSWLVERPIGEVIEQTFVDDTVRGVVLTDALIGTWAHAHDPSLRQNRCFLYHLIGNGTGEWRVPVGGMGAVTDALCAAATRAGAHLRTGTQVVRVEADGRRAHVRYVDGDGEDTAEAAYVLSGVAPATLSAILDSQPAERPEGSQVKLNLLLERLPRLRSGVDPRLAFAGTFHVGESYAELQQAYDEAAEGRFPSGAPAEVYCHTLSDSSILPVDLAAAGWHTLTLFGLHTPAGLFDGRNDELREQAIAAYLARINEVLEEPIEDCLARDRDGRPCVEAKTPLDLETALGMPGGHIFHGDLTWPWKPAAQVHGADDSPAAWGVETGIANVLICGSGARRGGGVSGIAGHNAAHAVLGRGD